MDDGSDGIENFQTRLPHRHTWLSSWTGELLQHLALCPKSWHCQSCLHPQPCGCWVFRHCWQHVGWENRLGPTTPDPLLFQLVLLWSTYQTNGEVLNFALSKFAMHCSIIYNIYNVFHVGGCQNVVPQLGPFIAFLLGSASKSSCASIKNQEQVL